MLKRVTFLLLAALCLRVPVFAAITPQDPGQCVITGKIWKANRTPAAGVTLRIIKIKLPGHPTSTESIPFTSDANGIITITTLQGAEIWLYGAAQDFNLEGGKKINVPTEATASLGDLFVVTLFPQTGLVVKDEGSQLQGLYGTINVVGSTVAATKASAGVAQFTVTAESPLTFSAPLSRSGNTVSLPASGVTPGSYNSANITVDAYGRVTAAANGSGGGGGSITVEEADGNPSVSAVSAIRGNQAHGLTVTSPGSGIAQFNLSGVPYSALALTDSIVNADIGNGAAIAYSKLNLTGAILNADLAGSIADTKLNTISTAGKVSDSALSSNVFYADGTRAGSSAATTGVAFQFGSTTLTGGSLLRGVVPESSFTGRIIDVRDNAGTPVDKFVVDATGAIVAGSIPYASVTSKSVVNADVAAGAAIAWTKISKTGSNLTDLATRNYSDLSGIPSTFAPSTHASSHQNGGSDEVATATPGANAIPKAGGSGTLAAGWLPDLSGTYQPLDADLTAVAGLSPSNDDVLQRKAGGWTNRTPAQFKVDLALVKGDVGLGNVENTALSTWAGSANITTVGTVTSGTWNGSVIGSAYGGAGTVNGILKANGSGTVAAATAGTDYSTPSSSETQTNKTFDAEGTGNSLTVPIKLWLPAAGANGSTAGTMWDLPTSSPAVAAVVTGSNVNKGVLQFADTGGSLSAQQTLYVPADFTGTVDVVLVWSTSATSGNCKWSVETSFTATDATATDDPSWNTASTVTTATPGTANRITKSTITGVTITNNGPSKLMHVRVSRDGGDASDTIGATANLIGVELTLRRAL